MKPKNNKNPMQEFNKNELDLLINELLPLNFNQLKDSDIKKSIEHIVNIHNPNNINDFSSVLDSLSLSKEAFFEKAFDDTLNHFFKKHILCFKKEDILSFKEDLLYLMKFDVFSCSKNIIFANYFSLFLKHIYETFKTLQAMKYKSDSYGTAFFNNSYNQGLESILNGINKQLDPSKFPFTVTSDEDIDRLKISKFFVKTFRNHTNIANYLIILNSIYDHNNIKIGTSKGHHKGLDQSFSFLNGLKTSKDTLLRSFMIKVSFPYKTKKINQVRLCQLIKNISRQFFEDIVFDVKNSKYKIGLSPRYLKMKTYISTSLMGNLIYAYDKNNEYAFLWKMSMDSAINFYSKMLIEQGYEHITKNKSYKPLMKKIFSNTIFPI